MSDTLGPCTPFFIVSDLSASLAHYVDGLGFPCRFSTPEDDPFFAMVGRGSAQIMLKHVAQDCAPLPNHRQHQFAPWDAFIYTASPDDLAQEYTSRNVSFHVPLGNRDDGLRGFEIADPDGYVCFFGCPSADL